MLSFWARKAERRDQSPRFPVGLETPREQAEEGEALASRDGDPAETRWLWGDRRVPHSLKDGFFSLVQVA